MGVYVVKDTDPLKNRGDFGGECYVLDRIDKKIEAMGFKKLDETPYNVSYMKRIYAFDPEKGQVDTGYCHVVEIKVIFDEGLKPKTKILSRQIGQSCSLGNFFCSKELIFDQAGCFFAKMKKIQRKMAFLMLKKRLERVVKKAL